MAGDEIYPNDKERYAQYALFLQQKVKPDGSVERYLHAENLGMPEGEVIASLEFWLEQAKQKFKDNFAGRGD